ncbi:FERM and PDZ domain-containing protein 1-like [Carassius carassius]|uniref:FERM and PDZ domain-containing protein 1-like n=1 Tax=Carassius carassius TaxID=217509 RepID=UPI0028690382|nr:FERM and PDZ domain-containing protein 1-like [Carassius carassius]XP_059407845.1 FERM and PDZ domain-containing protein 1-like [Carassius carassius]XP_059407846.1 FERM and PDZ domain-containing protein 1-like [Carassius carassius]XP_059407848.1 FERM and PDZ domain-containing protein 1-like [Carassius carassius]
MEERDRSRSPSRRTSRVEQVVGRWLRRSRESISRERVLEDGQVADNGSQEQRSCPIRVTVKIPLDPTLNSHGFTVSTHTPPQVLDVTEGGPADGKLVPGDQLFKINNVAVDDLSTEQAGDIIRECQNTIILTVLRNTVGPKSSFITPEKRAKLKSNPVKVRFAEEVVVNGHSQGNSLLFLPNVLKVYLENGQTKAFKFESKTTVKDIVMTLKEKLSISRIEHFSLVLEQQYSTSKLFLLHEEEIIQKVVEKKETHDYRCLFRVCFLPRDFTIMLKEDPVAFEYLYLQSVSDVLQERFAVEMKCNTALRLAALHVQEKLASSGQSLKTPLKAIMKEWGIESFVSHTLLRNMREKDLKKAISYHMKKILSQEPKQKVISVDQARLNYMNEMSEVKSYGGKAFSATMMLQDRESVVSLLVGAQYGVSQVINHKLSIMTTLTEFSSITRVEILPESDRVSLVKIYLQDIKPITLLMESVAAKDLLCLVAGYCRLLVDPQISVFPWSNNSKSHRISAEEGYVSHCGSDSDDSDTDVDALLAHVASTAKSNNTADKPNDKLPEEAEKAQSYMEKDEEVEKEGGKKEEVVEKKEREEDKETSHQSINGNNGKTVEIDDESVGTEKEDKGQEKNPEQQQWVIVVDDPSSEASDSYQTESQFMTSMSSDSIDALEEDDLMTYFSTRRPCHLPVKNSYSCEDRYSPSLSPRHPCSKDSHSQSDLCSTDSHCEPDIDQFFCSPALSDIAECLPSPPAASEEEDCEELGIEDEKYEKESPGKCPESTPPPPVDYVFTFEQGDTRHYYNICTNVTPDSARILPQPLSPSGPMETQPDQERGEANHTETVPIFQPPPGFGDSSSDDEFFDAQERFTPAEKPCSTSLTRENSEESSTIQVHKHPSRREKKQKEQDKMVTQVELSNFNKRSKKRRSFMETSYTSLVSFPEQDHLENSYGNSIPNYSINQGAGRMTCFEGGCSDQGPCPTVSSLTDSEGEPAQLESKPIKPSKVNGSGPHNPTVTQVGSHTNKSYQRKQQLIEMEPDSMEFKSVNELMSTASPAIVAVRSPINLQDKVSTSNHSRDDQEEGAVGGLVERLFGDHLFFDMSKGQCDSSVLIGQRDDKVTKQKEEFFQGSSVTQKSSSLPRLGQISPSSLSYFHVPSISYTTSPDVDRDNSFVHLKFGMGKHSVEPAERTRSQSMSGSLGSGPSRHLFSQRVRGPESEETDNNCDTSLQDLSSGVLSYNPAQRFLLTPCSSSILGRLSSSTLRGKIQNLPLYLSRSQEMLNGSSNGNGNVKPVRRLSETQLQKYEVELAKEATEDVTLNEGSPEVTEVKVVTIVSEEVTEVIEEVREVSHIGLKACGQLKTKTKPKEFSEICSRADNSLQFSPSSVVVTTQNLNGPWGVVTSSGLQECSHPPSSTTPHNFNSSCGVFANCQSKPTIAQPKSLLSPNQHEKPDLSCSSVLAMGCDSVMEGAQTHLEVCNTVYTNCFSGVLDSASFDDELTVYEFSRRTSQGETGDAVQTSVPLCSLSPSPASFSPSSPLPSFPPLVLPASSSTELSPLLSPLDAPDCFISHPHEDIITSLLTRQYPLPPTGFLSLQRDVDTLLNVLAGAMKNQDGVHKHPRDACVAHFSENKRRLHAEARRLLAGCQRVVRVGQTPEETLQSLSESFCSLVQLTSVCICFSNCQRCRERHGQALTGLASVAKTYLDFARAAELVGSASERKTCHDLSIKLLARQCTALTTSVFCLTQLFRTLTAL